MNLKALKNNRTLKNFSVLTLSNLMVQALSIFSSIKLARQLEPEGYGMFNYILTVSGMLVVIAAFGLRLVIIRTIARDKSLTKMMFKFGLIIRFGFSLIAFIVGIIYINYFAITKLDPVLFGLVIVHILLTMCWDTIESVAFGNQRMEASGIIKLIATSIWVASLYIIPDEYFTATFLFFIFVSNFALKDIFYYLWVRKTIIKKLPEHKIDEKINAKALIGQSKYFFLLAVFTAIQNQFSLLFLDFNSTIEQIGIFNLGHRILSPLQMSLRMALNAVFPKFSALALKDRDRFYANTKKMVVIILILGCVLSLIFTIFSKNIIWLLYGEKYIDSATVITIQCWYNVLYGVFCVIGTVLSSSDQQKKLSFFSFLSTIVAVPCYLIGSKYGAWGLSLGFLSAGVINMIYHWIFLMKLSEKRITMSFTIKVFAFLLSSMFVAYIFPQELDIWIKLGIVFGVGGTLGLLYKSGLLKNQLKYFSIRDMKKVSKNDISCQNNG